MPPSIRQIAKEAGVSPSTVSRFLSGELRLTSDTEARIASAIHALGEPAQMLKGQSIRHVALMIPELSNPFFASLVDRLNAVACQHGLQIAVFISNSSVSNELSILEEISDSNWIDAAILIGSHSLEGVVSPLSLSKPFVMLDEVMWDPHKHGLHYVGADNEIGAFQATSHLISKGHKEIAFVSGPSDLVTAQARLAGFERAMATHKIPLRSELVFFGPFSEAFGAACLSSIVTSTPMPTAVLASSDVAAIGLLAAAKRHGISVPEDLSVVGIDDIDLCNWLNPPLDSVRQPIDEMATRTVLMLKDIAYSSEPTVVSYPMQLMIRSSVRSLNNQ